MPWFRVDDGFALHPKALAAGNAAVGLWVRAGSWSAQQLTEGFVPTAVVAVLGGKPKDAKALVTAGLWLEAEGGYRFHQWDERQPTKESVEADREAARERQRSARQRAREARESQRSSPDVTRDEPVTHADVTPGVTVPPSLPVPSLPSELQPPPTSEVAARATKPKRATRLPEDYALTEVMTAWAASQTPSVDPVREFDRFRDFWRAARDGAKRDWDATWRNWMRKAQDESGGSRGSRGGGPRPSTTDQRVADAQALKAQLRPEAAQLAIGAS